MHLSFRVSRDCLWHAAVAFTCTHCPASISVNALFLLLSSSVLPSYLSVFCCLPLQNGMFYTSYVSTYLANSPLILFNLLLTDLCEVFIEDPSHSLESKFLISMATQLRMNSCIRPLGFFFWFFTGTSFSFLF